MAKDKPVSTLIAKLMEHTNAKNYQQLSAIIGLNPSMVSRLNTGSRNALSLGTLHDIKATKPAEPH